MNATNKIPGQSSLADANRISKLIKRFFDEVAVFCSHDYLRQSSLLGF